MRLHFCETCGQQFTSEGDLPRGATLCESCREKQGLPPAPKPGRTNTLLRTASARGNSRARYDGRPRAGVSPALLWGGILLLIAFAALLTFIMMQRSPPETRQPLPQQQPTDQR